MQKSFDVGREILKWIAVITMTIDHLGAILYPEIMVLRFIGRLSFPLFCYLIVLGMESTRSVRNYFTRLFLFALISQVPFYLALNLASGYGPFDSLNIFFTLSSGVLFIHFFKKNSLLALLPVLASLLNFDYGPYGIAMIGCMYILRKDTEMGVVLLVLLNLLFSVASIPQTLSLSALPIILLHNNGYLKIERQSNGKTAYALWRKYFFYIYYPVHLFVLYLIKLYYF